MNTHNKNVFVSAGEVSGDQILSKLLQRLKSTPIEYEVHGVFGAECEKLGYHSLMKLQKIAANGILDVLMNIHNWIILLSATVINFKKHRYSLVILIDFPGFNLRLLKYCKKKGIPVYYIAPPQVWPYKKKNLSIFNNVYVQLLFEIDRKPYLQANAKVSTGHFFKEPPSLTSVDSKQLGVFPGSRKKIVMRNLPYMIKAIGNSPTLRQNYPMKTIFIPPYLKEVVQKIISQSEKGPPLFEINTHFHDLKKLPMLALAVPGTITLELALREIPTVVLCVLDKMTYYVGKHLLKTPQLALPSGLLGRQLFPEVVGPLSKIKHADLEPVLNHLVKITGQSSQSKELFDTMGNAQGLETAVNNCLKLLDQPVEK